MRKEPHRLLAKQCHSTVSHTVLARQHVKRTQPLHGRSGRSSTGRNSALVDALIDGCHQRLVVDVPQRSPLTSRQLPTKLLWVAKPDALVKHFARHGHGRVLHFVVRLSVVGVRCAVVDRRWEIDGNHHLPLSAWHRDILRSQVDGRRKLSHLPCNLLPCPVCHVLPKYRQLCGMDAKEQPAAIRIQERAARLHTLHQLASRLFRLHHAVLLAMYDSLNILYGQFFHLFQIS